MVDVETLASRVETVNMKLLHVFRMLGVGLAGTRVAAEAQPRESPKSSFRSRC